MKKATAEITFKVTIDVQITQQDFAAAVSASFAGGVREVFGEIKARALARAADEITCKLIKEASRLQHEYAGIPR